jgi:hypothetical protein
MKKVSGAKCQVSEELTPRPRGELPISAWEQNAKAVVLCKFRNPHSAIRN